MNFIDFATIYVKAGNGGNGCTAFLREKFRPKGGPSGGDGGRGGHIIIQSDSNLSTLKDVSYKRRYFQIYNTLENIDPSPSIVLSF